MEVPETLPVADGDTSVSSWANRLPPSLLGKDEAPPTISPQASPKKTPVTSPVKALSPAVSPSKVSERQQPFCGKMGVIFLCHLLKAKEVVLLSFTPEEQSLSCIVSHPLVTCHLRGRETEIGRFLVFVCLFVCVVLTVWERNEKRGRQIQKEIKKNE